MAKPPMRPTSTSLEGAEIEARKADGADRPLTDQQARFVQAIAQAAAEGVTLANYEAAQMAGYTGSRDVLQVTASRTLQKPHVKAALIAALREVMVTELAPVALRRLGELTRRADKDAVSAGLATRILEGAGIITETNGGAGSASQILIQINAPGFTGGAYAEHLAGRLAQAQQIRQSRAIDHGINEGEGEAEPPG